MEAVSCVKAVILAASQYKNNQSDDSLLHLHRQLDVLISITSKGSPLAFLHPKQLLSTECVACLVEIMNDPQTKAALAHKTMTLLNNLANASFLREFFHSTFDVTAVLISYVHSRLSQPMDENAILCIRLLQKLTYKAETSAQKCYVEELVNFLLHQIVEVAENDLTPWCLGLLANLCRNNMFVRSFVKSRENCKAVYKKLMAYLSHQSQKVEIYAISIISNLCLEDEIGKRIFRDQNIHQVFQLLFNILHSGEPGMTQQYAVDLFIDIVQFEKFQHSLVSYDHLLHCLQQILLLLTSSESNTCAMILELLIGFCHVRELRSAICQLMLEPLTRQDIQVDLTQLMLNRHKVAPLFGVIFWAAQPTECHENVHLLALDLLYLLHQAAFSERLALEEIAICQDLVVTVIQEIVSCSMPPASIFIRNHLQRKLKALSLLKILCDSTASCDRIMSQFNINSLYVIIEQQLTTNTVGLNSNFPAHLSADDPIDSSEVGLDLVLVILDLLVVLSCKGCQCKAQLDKVLQDSRLVPLLAYSLTSTSKEQIQTALRLTVSAVNLAEFSMTLLADNMSWLSRMWRSSCLSLAKPSSAVVSSLSSSSLTTSSTDFGRISSNTSDLDVSVQNLIDKMQNGLKVKDVRSSELIAIYEYRLQSLQTKENGLQDLLETKAAALLQSDRFLAQSRLRIAQCEAEGHKLRSLLQESERCKEDLEEKLETVTAKFEELHTELEQLGQENIRLEDISHKYKQLSQDHAEQVQKLEICQRSLMSLKREHESLVEMDEMLKKHYETLRQQHDRATKQVLELEEEKNCVSGQLKDRDAKVFDLSRSLQKTEENLKKRVTDCDELEVAIDKLRAELARTEQAKKELHHQVSSLEVVCRQREASIKEKDLVIGQMKTDLEKHAQLAALIHSLSSGKAPPTNPPASF